MNGGHVKNFVILLVFVVLFSAVPVFAQAPPPVTQIAMEQRVSTATRVATVAPQVSRSKYQWFSTHDGCPIRGRHVHGNDWKPSVAVPRGSVNDGSSEKIETVTENLGGHEVMRVFLEKGFVSAPSEKADFTAEIKTFVQDRARCFATSRYSVRQRCYSDPERVAYVTLKNKDGASVAVGQGDDREVREAIKDAAEDAANKIKERKGKSIFIDVS